MFTTTFMRWLRRETVVAMLALTGVGCGGATAAMAPVGSDSFDAAAPPRVSRPAQHKPREGLPADVVERAACDFAGVRADGQALSTEELYGELGRASVLCVGEDPADARHHWVELTLLRELSKRAPARGLELGLGLEMFAARDQRKLDAYATKEVGETELLSTTRYDDSWGHDFALYRPLLEYAVSRGILLVGLNAPTEITTKVAAGGLEALSPDQVESLPELDIDGDVHRHSVGDGGRAANTATNDDNAHAAEVVSVETAAEKATLWVNERRPARQLIILARTKDCEHTAIPARLARRGTSSVISVRAVAETPATSVPTIPGGFDYVLVMAGSGGGAEPSE
jgi:hypothetical protein